jgi:metal-responsive CopG/Arc/MetJ family transcriptional regulator
MKRTTVTLPDDLAQALDREAQRRRVSVSEVVRQALMVRLGVGPGGRRGLSFAAVGRSGYRHTARDLEDVLAQEWDGAGRR